MIDGWTEEQHEPTVRHERPAAPQDVRRVMLLGSAEPSRELAIALQGLGAEVIAVDGYVGAPAHRIADQSVVVTMTDAEELTAVIRRLQPDFLVTVTAAVSVDALDAVEQADGECTELVPGSTRAGHPFSAGVGADEGRDCAHPDRYPGDPTSAAD